MLHQSRSDRLEYEIVPDPSVDHPIYATIVEAVQSGAMRPGDRLARMWGIPDIGTREKDIVRSPCRGETTVLSCDYDGTSEEA